MIAGDRDRLRAGRTSAYTWLKVPVVEDMERVMAATTLPALLLGGEVTDDPDAALPAGARRCALPTVRGLVVGRTLLYPPDDDVAAAVDAAVEVTDDERHLPYLPSGSTAAEPYGVVVTPETAGWDVLRAARAGPRRRATTFATGERRCSCCR